MGRGETAAVEKLPAATAAVLILSRAAPCTLRWRRTGRPEAAAEKLPGAVRRDEYGPGARHMRVVHEYWFVILTVAIGAVLIRGALAA